MTTATNTVKDSTTSTNGSNETFARFSAWAEQAPKYSIVLILLWMGGMKFTAYEAGAIEGLVASSPFTGWLYSFFSLQGAANLIGTAEIATAAVILLGVFNRKLALAGALAAVATFSVTLSMLLTAPGWEASLGGFPALSVVPGQFLLKDAVLLAVSLSLLGKALRPDSE
ncbi:MAG: hypothetical protein DHS20C12_28680 [Pseudohongiella sp.]|nr:MAG: hypothetical protein DHS20C12_28680 [Pseudohongiella sp.]